jgi:hypothetical protein
MLYQVQDWLVGDGGTYMWLEVDTSHTYMAVKQFLNGMKERLRLVGVAAAAWRGLDHVTVFPRTFPAATYLATRCGVEQAPVTVVHMTPHAASTGSVATPLLLMKG